MLIIKQTIVDKIISKFLFSWWKMRVKKKSFFLTVFKGYVYV